MESATSKKNKVSAGVWQWAIEKWSEGHLCQELEKAVSMSQMELYEKQNLGVMNQDTWFSGIQPATWTWLLDLIEWDQEQRDALKIYN